MPSDDKSKNMPDPTYEAVNTGVKGNPKINYNGTQSSEDAVGSGAIKKISSEQVKRNQDADAVRIEALRSMGLAP